MKIIENKGITIISLIVTIIILLILSGITVGVITNNNGSLVSATKAKFMSEVKEIEEKIELEEISKNDGEDFQFGTLKELIGREDEYNEILYIENGNLVYIENEVSEEQAEWLEDMGITPKQNIIPIYTAEQLKKIGSNEEVSIEELGGETFKFSMDSHYMLQNDINLNCSNENQWKPLAANTGNPFKGILDGNNYQISGIYIVGDIVAGLFVYNRGTIKNINLTDGYIEGTGTKSVAGIVVVNYGKVINCKNQVEIKCYGNYSGGIVAQNMDETALIENCENNAYLDLKSIAGGICGQNKGIVRNCRNLHEILLQDFNLGGIVGLNDGTQSIVEQCYNIGNILMRQEYSRYGRGGVVGTNNGMVRYCFNTGTINSYTSSWDIGGIVGRNNSGATINFSYNAGQVNGTQNTGGIVGNNTGKIKNSYSSSSIELSGTNTGTIVNSLKLTEQQIKNKDKIILDDNSQTNIINLLNSEEEKYIEDIKNENKGYPILKQN